MGFGGMMREQFLAAMTTAAGTAGTKRADET
jgi:hypothetical protein